MKKMLGLLLICPLLFSCNANEPSGPSLSEQESQEVPSITVEPTAEPVQPTEEPTEKPTVIPSEPTIEPTPVPEINFTKKVDMTYEFTGDEKDKAGFAQGVITITPTESKKKSGYYLIYLANDTSL